MTANYSTSLIKTFLENKGKAKKTTKLNADNFDLMFYFHVDIGISFLHFHHHYQALTH